MAQYGEFDVRVSSPYPVWIEVSHHGRTIKFSHRELPDLIWALNRARAEAYGSLPPKDQANLMA